MDGTSDENVTEGESSNKLECAVCLQQCIQPVQLPCRHIFCYLCVKGVTQQSKRCAMCRQEIPLNYLDNPQLIFAPQASVAFEGEYQWFYEGRNGWWQYDDRTSTEIEAAYKKGETQCEVLIAGFLYIIDFEKNLQVRRCDPHRRRHIKRDLVTIAKKGVAGIRLDSSDNEIFNSIAQGLKNHGYSSITGQMCHEKSQSLKVSYIKVKDGQSKIGSAQITFQHSDEIDEITGKKPNVPGPIMHKNSDAGSSFQDLSSCSSEDEDIDEATPVDHACPTEKAKRKAPSNWYTVCEEIRKKRHEEKMAQMMKIHQDNLKIQNKFLNILEGFKK